MKQTLSLSLSFVSRPDYSAPARVKGPSKNPRPWRGDAAIGARSDRPAVDVVMAERSHNWPQGRRDDA